jgi:hypothetical protein
MITGHSVVGTKGFFGTFSVKCATAVRIMASETARDTDEPRTVSVSVPMESTVSGKAPICEARELDAAVDHGLDPAAYCRALQDVGAGHRVGHVHHFHRSVVRPAVPAGGIRS